MRICDVTTVYEVGDLTPEEAKSLPEVRIALK